MQRHGQHRRGGNTKQLQRRLSAHTLASYYSDARLNILTCLNDVRVKTGLKPIKDEGQNVSALESLTLNNETPEGQEAQMRLLRRRFPFLNPMTDPKTEKADRSHNKAHESELSNKERAEQEENAKDRAEALRDVRPADFENRLHWLFRLVHDLRNTLVHPTEGVAVVPREIHKYLFLDLGKVYDASLNTVASRFGLDAKIKQPLLRKGKKGELRPFSEFSLALCTDPKEREKRAPIEAEHMLHDFGHVLLCALFLEKSQSAELISYFWQAGYAAHWNARQQALVRELIAVYRIRLPMQRLRFDESVSAIAINTLSELSRCPELLFDTLDEEDRKHFRIGASLNAPKPDAKVGPELDAPDVSYLMVRRRDYFVPLMMRMLDLDPKTRLRFAVDLGSTSSTCA